MKTIKTLMLATALLLPVSTVFAADAAAGDDAPAPSLASELNLSKAQQQRIDAIRKDEQKRIAAVDTSKIEPGVFRDMIKAGKWDETRARNRIDAVGDVDNQVTYIRVKALFDISQVLTGEQRQHFAELFKKELAAD
ncbi:Spy/CpxP family protein refolding chaperone [Jeongeupia sp. USM3]|uniref:Spy/CpxP family protein refolding chaperone n=1 Tax=Jeongeupia sp. USM3 TaxID=1906741 RepID=UPI00089DEA60|nr:Spy/CpxP family protein refolding chaperone [Jeongeupia sp. USM3]AOY01681.1 hypothetical protein BJP62_15175 [Jeongeupia sp. USM3]